MLFDQKPRKYMGPGRYSESYYKYLDRSARKACEHIRLLLNDWHSHFPADSQKKLEDRFRSPDDDFVFLSAFVELYLHELLLRLGFEVDIEPEIDGVSGRPDFLVKLNKKPIFILECTLSTASREELTTEKIKNELYDELNRIYSPNFSITPSVRGIFQGKSYTWPPIKKWCKSLEKELSELDPNEIEARKKRQGPATLPYCSKEYDGLFISIMIEPKPLNNRGKPEIPNIRLRFDRSEAREAEFYIKKAIKKKVKKYGILPLPYIIAINVMHRFCFDSSISKALFGQNIPKGARLNLIKPSKSNGSWWGPDGHRNTRVSAVLIFKQLVPWNIAKQSPVLWHNPWAKIPLNPDILQLAQNIFKFEAILKEHKLGKSAVEIFNLSSNWPRMK